MATKSQPISPALVLGTAEGRPGYIYVTSLGKGFEDPRTAELTPEEADQLVLHALSMTAPPDLGINEGAAFQSARDAVRAWQVVRANHESLRQRDAERDQLLKDAGFKNPYTSMPDPVRALVDMVITERRKAEQK